MTMPLVVSRDALAAAIAGLRRADSRSHARSLARVLTAHVGTMDTQLRAAFAAALEHWQLDPSVASAPLALDIGQTWLLLHAGGRTGHVARVVARYDDGRSTASAPSTRIRSSELGQLLHALGAACARACRQLPADLLDGAAVEIAGGLPSVDVTGRSLELGAAIALLSRATSRAPTATMAASASVRADGSLGVVTHLAEKLDALRNAYPDVRAVVVAKGQELPEGARDFDVHRVGTLDEALDHFGLDLRSLSPSPLEDHLSRARSFATANTHAHSPERWRRLSLDAWESSIALAAHEPPDSASCRAWAALFAVHAGDPATAAALMRDQDPAVFTAHPATGVWTAIGQATGAIDREDFAEAEGHARRAVRACEELAPHERAALQGQALGTLGRALMHAGRHSDAEPVLRQGAEHHREHAPKEQARSLMYVATCLRHGGSYDAALAVVDEALAINARHVPSWRAAQTTEHYLRLEKGRVLIDRKAYDEAERELLSVTPHAELASYPRVGAERSLVRLHLRAGRDARALEAWLRCLDAARQLLALKSDVSARVASIGLLEGARHGLDVEAGDRDAAVAVCEAAFGRRLTTTAVDELIGAWIY